MTLEVIRNYRGNRATHHQLMRRLVTFDGWYVPIDVARRATGRANFDTVCMYGDTCRHPADQLWLFSSAEDAMKAHEQTAAHTGHGLAPYAGPVAGAEVFASLSRQLQAVVIDIVGGREDKWVIEGPALDVARRWGQAVTVEKALHSCSDDVFVAMLGYDDYLVFETMGGSLATAPAADGSASYVMAFTAIDAVELALMRYTGTLRKIATRSGRELFADIAEAGARGDGELGLVINLAGPTPPMLPFEPAVCSHLAELARLLDVELRSA